MTEQELAAPSEAADEAAVSAVTEASEATENTQGQVEDQPAEGDESPEEKSKSKARRERREAADRRDREEREAESRRLREAETRLERIKAATKAVAEPVEADFADYVEYVAAKGAWKQAQLSARFTENEVKAEIDTVKLAQQQAEQLRTQERVKEFTEAIPEARARYADFDQVIAVAQRADVVSSALSMMILESDAPHDVAYHLGKNPELARTLSAMNPVAAARELGRIEARLSAPRPKTTTEAPAPISPVRGTAKGSRDPSKMSYSEFKAYREAGGKLG